MLTASVLVVGGAVLLGTSMSAFAAATLTAVPSTGLVSGQAVTLTGSGFAKSSIGEVVECNSDPSQPTVALPSPVLQTVAVSCLAPSYTELVNTNAKGDLSTVFDVLVGTTGPPCGPTAIATCPATDSAGKSPTADAALYPCPPTAAQQAAGDFCTLKYGDASNDSATVAILFQGESTGTPTTTTTAAPTTTTTAAPTTTTTAAPTTTTTAAPTTAGAGGGGSGGTTPTASNVESASSSSLAFTGTGRGVGIVAVLGGIMILLGLAVLLLADAPRRAISYLALLNPRAARNSEPGSMHRAAPLWERSREFAQSVTGMAKRTGAWFLGR
jgi:hypothetical protein